MDDDNTGSEVFQSQVSISGFDSFIEVDWTLPNLQEIWPFSFRAGSPPSAEDKA